MTAFQDPLSITVVDPDHSVGEARFLLIGTTVWRRLVVVSHTETTSGIRLIGASRATRRERETYEEDA